MWKPGSCYQNIMYVYLWNVLLTIIHWYYRIHICFTPLMKSCLLVGTSGSSHVHVVTLDKHITCCWQSMDVDCTGKCHLFIVIFPVNVAQVLRTAWAKLTRMVPWRCNYIREFIPFGRSNVKQQVTIQTLCLHSWCYISDSSADVCSLVLWTDM